MGKGNPVMRVSKEFERMVKSLSDQANKTTAEITKELAQMIRRNK